MARYINFNAGSLPPLDNKSDGILTRVISVGSNMSSTTLTLIGGVILLIIFAIVYYFYYVSPSLKPIYKPNSEPPTQSSSNSAEMLFFYADWCPHCKAAKPIWNDLKSEYENKTINGYKVVFVEIDCSEETTEVEKLINQYSVEGYPTIKLIKDGELIEYDAKPSRETLTKFLNTVL